MIDVHRIVLLLTMCLVAPACAVAGGGDELLVGAVYPTAGSQGPGGIEEWRGVELAADLANERGGVDGRPIRLLLEETGTGEAAPAAVERLAGAGAEVVVGSYGSTISRPAAAAASRHGVVFWETGAVGELGMTAATGEYVFRFPASGGVLGREAVAFVRERVAPAHGHEGPLRWAVTYVDDVYGRSVGLGAVAEVAARGEEVVAHLPYDLRDLDAAALMREVADAGADVLVVSAYLDDGVELRRELVRQEVDLVTSIGTSSSYCMREFGALLGHDAVGLFASDKPSGDVMDPDRLSPEAAEALRWARDEYRRRHGDVMTAPALTGFAGAWALFGHVLPAAASPEADAIAQAARSVRLEMGELPNGSGLELAGPGHPDAGANLRATSVIWQWVAEEQREVVWPPAFATHDMVVGAG